MRGVFVMSAIRTDHKQAVKAAKADQILYGCVFGLSDKTAANAIKNTWKKVKKIKKTS